MSKHSQRTSQKQNSRSGLYLASGIGLLLVVVLAAVFAFTQTPADTAAEDTSQLISPGEYQSQFVASRADHVLIDVRTPQEFASGHIAGAINIPVESLSSRLSEVPTDQTIVLYCRSGNRSAQASRILEQAGYAGIYDLGGIIDWTAQGFPIE
jgi:phage shock protein E